MAHLNVAQVSPWKLAGMSQPTESEQVGRGGQEACRVLPK